METSTDPHLESIQFIRSAGAWNADGDRFVFGAVTGSDPVLTVVDVSDGETTQEKVFPDLGEIFNPTWSPDGGFVAFSAVVGGFSDLYVYDFQGDVLRRLTDDPFTDLHPSWSPDGRTIVFFYRPVHHRPATACLWQLSLGRGGRPTTGAIEPVASFPRGKNINPQWSPDGKSIYFLGDPRGITNAYRLDLTTNEIYQVTNLFTGISGITALSPALSVAKDVEKVAFSVYERGDYNIYVVEDPAVLRGERVSDTTGERLGASRQR